MADHQNTRQDWPLRGSGPVWLTLGGLVAAFGVASCCALPLALATLGLGTAWLGGLALLAAPHRPLLLAAAAVCLFGAVILLWRQRGALACAPGAICTHRADRRMTMLGVLVGLVLLCLGYTYA